MNSIIGALLKIEIIFTQVSTLSLWRPIMTTLAGPYTDIWEADFDSTEEAQQELRKLQKACSDLAVGVRLAIESKRTALKREEKKDVWTEIRAADLALLTSTSPNRIAQAYKTALDEVPA